MKSGAVKVVRVFELKTFDRRLKILTWCYLGNKYVIGMNFIGVIIRN